jgi:hypothetical protein
MARKTTPRPWLQVFQKSSSGVESDHVRPSGSQSTITDEELSAIADRTPDFGEDEPFIEEKLPQREGYVVRAKRFVSNRSNAAIARLRPWAGSHKWLLIFVGMLGAAGATGIAAWMLISLVPPAVDCKKISSWSADSERLYCAQQAAQSGKAEDLLDAIKVVEPWGRDHYLYGQSQLLMQDWSNALMILARERVAQRDLKGGIWLASQVPDTSPNYKEVQATITRWKEENRRGEVLYAKIQTVLKKQNWDKAAEHMAELSLINDPTWQDRLGEIRQQITAERLAWQAFLDARNFAKANPAELLGRAIALTDAINRKTYVWDLQAKKEVEKWRNTIFTLALAKLDKKDIPGAGLLINSIPKSVQLTSANVDFVRLVRAKEVETTQDFNAPSLERVVPLMLATHLLKQVDTQSPFYDRAKTLAPKLDMQFQDLLQLNAAGALSNVQQIPTLQWAIQQAESIKPGRPGRTYAQTLLAQWKKELQTLEDRPVLKQAQQLAKPGKLEQLRSAVALVSLIKPKRALGGEAQKNAGDWVYQIQVIEDRPIIEEAQAIASSGRLGTAIDTASKIAPGRALYPEAQNLIGGWIYEIQLAEDRSIIGRASAVASQGSLSRAIDIAYQISPGRPLYREAQGLIAQWSAELAEIRRQRERSAPPPEPVYEEPTQEAPSSRDYPQEPQYEPAPQPQPSRPTVVRTEYAPSSTEPTPP